MRPSITGMKRVMAEITSRISRYARSLITGRGHRPQRLAITSSKLLENTFRFVVNECVTGDYYEFGVFEGSTFISAAQTFERVVQRRIKVADKVGDGPMARSIRSGMAANMRFHAFDSFEGLPKLQSADLISRDFVEEQFLCVRKDFEKNIKNAGLEAGRVSIHEGYFEELAKQDYTAGLPKAAVIWLDCDLYSSSVAAYKLISNLIQDGTVLIIDDWFSYKGSRFAGPQLAFREWSESNSIASRYYLNPFHKEDWKRNSFILNEIK